MDAQFSLLIEALVSWEETAPNLEATSSLEQSPLLCNDRYDRYELRAYVAAQVCSNRIEGQR